MQCLILQKFRSPLLPAKSAVKQAVTKSHFAKIQITIATLPTLAIALAAYRLPLLPSSEQKSVDLERSLRC